MQHFLKFTVSIGEFPVW